MSVGRDPLTGRYRYVNRTIRGGKRTAQRAAAQLINEVEHGGHREMARGSLAQLLDQWMTHIEAQGRAASTLTRYRSALSANIVPAGQFEARPWRRRHSQDPAYPSGSHQRMSVYCLDA